VTGSVAPVRGPKAALQRAALALTGGPLAPRGPGRRSPVGGVQWGRLAGRDQPRRGARAAALLLQFHRPSRFTSPLTAGMLTPGRMSAAARPTAPALAGVRRGADTCG
jgi:hypothetical protein